MRDGIVQDLIEDAYDVINEAFEKLDEDDQEYFIRRVKQALGDDIEDEEE